jgi:alcohol dehydrogenase class IV
MKAFILSLLTKAGAKLSGPAGWLASLFIDKILKFIADKLKIVYKQVKEKMRLDKDLKKDKELVEKYQEALKSGNQEAINQASSDLLNGVRSDIPVNKLRE